MTAQSVHKYRRGFTLVELLVVIVILSILASLSLAGLAVTRQRSRIDKTKSTIRKINELIVPHYESLVRRRVPMDSPPPSSPLQLERLQRIRTVTMLELPDSWDDVAVAEKVVSGAQLGQLTTSGSFTTINPWAWTGVPRSYLAYRQSLPKDPRQGYPSSECLHMIVSRGLGEPDGMEQFRSDEIGDVDGDKAPEFIDGWGRPIAFMRWPVGFVNPLSPIQFAVLGPDSPHDPFDPLKLEANAFPLTPLIYSAGPDGDNADGYGLVRLEAWHIITLSQIFSATDGATPPKLPKKPGEPSAEAPNDYRDNISNHDLISK